MSHAATQIFTTPAFEDIFRAHERFLWGLCYRMTGNAADADDLVQETFVRAWKQPPARTDEPWRPWLTRVAMNLSRDLLRRRRRRHYEGPWLPSPIETGDEASPPSYEPVDEQGNPAARYDMLESVSFAFLLALEALTPAQRAVLLLRDVFDYSVREAADALGMSEPSVKTTHHRARRAMRDYDRDRARRRVRCRNRRGAQWSVSYIVSSARTSPGPKPCWPPTCDTWATAAASSSRPANPFPAGKKSRSSTCGWPS